jgi:hypothetical protein
MLMPFFQSSRAGGGRLGLFLGAIGAGAVTASSAAAAGVAGASAAGAAGWEV